LIELWTLTLLLRRVSQAMLKIPAFKPAAFFICLVGSVNSVLKFLGQPGETQFQPGGDEISSGFPMTFNTKLTEPKGK